MKNRTSYLFVGLVLLVCSISYSQQPKRDSLWTIWSDVKLADTLRFKALNEFAATFSQKEIDSTLFYRKMQLDFAKGKQLKKESAVSLNALGHVFLTKREYKVALSYFEKSFATYKTLDDNDGMAAVVNDMSSVYYRDYKAALSYFEESLATHKTLNDNDGMATALNNMGSVYYMQADYEKAAEQFKKSLAVSENTDDYGLPFDALAYLGIISRIQGQYTRALEYYHECLSIAEANDYKMGIATTLNNIGNIYKFQKNYPKALEYNFKSLAIKESLGYKQGMTYSLFNIADIYRGQAKYEKALEYLTRCLELSTEIDFKYNIADALIGIGDAYVELENYTLGRDYLKRGLKMAQEEKQKSQSADALTLFAKSYSKQKNHTKARFYSNQSLKIAQKIGDITLIEKNAEILYLSFKNTGNYAQALSMKELVVKMHDSITNKTVKEQLIRREYEYEYQKQKAIDSIYFEQKVQINALHYQSNLEREKSRRYLLYGGLITLLVITLVIYVNYRIKQQINLQLEASKIELKGLNDKLKLFAHVVAHDLKSPIISFKALIEKFSDKYGDSFSDRDTNLLQITNRQIGNLNALVRDLLLFYSLGDKNLKLEETAVDFQKLVAKIKLELDTTFQTDIPIKAEGLPTLQLNENLMYQLFTNLMTNSVKYAKTDVPIEITITAEKTRGDTYEFCVADNGMGIAVDFRTVVFDIFTRVTKSNKLGQGVGLPICKNIIDYYKGSIRIEDNANSGTSIFFSIPVPDRSALLKT